MLITSLPLPDAFNTYLFSLVSEEVRSLLWYIHQTIATWRPFPSLPRWRISELLEAFVGLHSHRVFPFKSSLAVSPKVWCICQCMSALVGSQLC